MISLSKDSCQAETRAWPTVLQANGSSAVDAGPSVVQTMPGLSLDEENDMRVEHALEILKTDVSSDMNLLVHAALHIL